jgi:hypothetical protein
MNFSSKLLITLVLCIVVYLLYSIVLYRKEYYETYYLAPPPTKETDENVESFESFPLIKSNNTVNLPIMEYAIMSSWNSALETSNKVSLQALERVLKRGYRFLDMELYLVDDQVQVSYSSETGSDIMESEPILFFDVCKLIATQAFYVSNNEDPLFLHLRVRTPGEAIYPKIADSLVGHFESHLYKKPVTKNTLFSDIQGKIVVVFDLLVSSGIRNYECKGNCRVNMKNMVSVYSGSSTLVSSKQHVKIDEPKRGLEMKDDENLRTNVRKWQMVTHGLGVDYEKQNSEHFTKLLLEHSVQIVPHKVYSMDENIDKYEEFFMTNGKRAFVPLAVALRDGLLVN